MSDVVNHPSHYTQAGVPIEPIDVIRWAPFDLGNCLKYILRAGHKGDELTDWRKAYRYFLWTVESYKQHPDHYDWFFETHWLYLRKFNVFRRLENDTSLMVICAIGAFIKSNIDRLEDK